MKHFHALPISWRMLDGMLKSSGKQQFSFLDEESMTPANAVQIVNVRCRDITQISKPFGSKFMLLGGDL